MENVSVSEKNQTFNFIQARERAVAEAREHIQESVIVAWKDDNTGVFAPAIPGANDERWHDYGESFGGQLELSEGDHYHFIFTDSSRFDKPDINLKTISGKDGGYFLCLNDACTDEDRRQFGAPYGGGLGDSQAAAKPQPLATWSNISCYWQIVVDRDIHDWAHIR